MNISSFKTLLRKLIPVVTALNLIVFVNHTHKSTD
jgi:hypothetical protein